MAYDSLDEVFISDIKKYLIENVNKLMEEYELDKVKIKDAYDYSEIPTPPQISVLKIDESEDNDSNSYNEGENLTRIVLQFYCYGKEMKIKDSETRYNPIKVVSILASYVKKSLSKNIIATKNKNIISVRRTTQTPPMQVRDNSLYYSVIRYEFLINNNYKIIYKD